MKIVFVVLCILTFSASAAVLKNLNNFLYQDTLFKKLSVDDTSLESSNIIGNYSDYVDKTLALIRTKAVNASSITLPSYNDLFIYKILYIYKSTVNLYLTSGNFRGFSSIQRNGDSLIIYNSTSKKMTASVYLLYPELVFDYEMEVHWIFGSSKAHVSGSVKNAAGTITMSVNAQELNVTLDVWNFTNPQNVDIQIKDGGYTVNYLAAPILKSLNNIFTEKIWVYTMNIVLKSETEKFLNMISKSLFKN